MSGLDPPGGPATGGRVEAFGDAALLLTLGDQVGADLAARAQAIATAIDEARRDEPGLGRAVPSHASVLVPFDPLAIEPEAVAAILRRVTSRPRTLARTVDERAPIEIAVRYGGADGPDLDEVAALHDLHPSDVVELHAGAAYRVLFLGFAPGFAYLGGLPAGVVTPRRATPRTRVPAGSVGIAGEQTGVYPLAMPGGWQLIGRTETRLWDVTRRSPALLRPGDAVRFVPAR